jgi:hypothetical protein
MKFNAQINGKPIKNPFLKVALGLVGITVMVSLFLLLARPLLGLVALGAVAGLVALPFVAKFGKISKIKSAPKPVKPIEAEPRLGGPDDIV